MISMRSELALAYLWMFGDPDHDLFEVPCLVSAEEKSNIHVGWRLIECRLLFLAFFDLFLFFVMGWGGVGWDNNVMF